MNTDINLHPEESNDPEHVEGPWYVYICVSRANHYYVGISPDPIKRLSKHNSGQGAKMAIDQGYFKILYISKNYKTKSLARRREVQIKKWSRIKKENLINGIWK